MENLVLVDKNDTEIGIEEKVKCHEGKGILHRAFTILLFNNDKRVLLQKRAKNKMLWPLHWEATCSGHPKKTESYKQSGQRRLREELNIDASLKLTDKFVYHSFYKDIGAEHEVCATLIGNCNKENIDFNRDEVVDVKWVSIDELRKVLKENPDDFVPWLEIALNGLFKKYGDINLFTKT